MSRTVAYLLGTRELAELRRIAAQSEQRDVAERLGH